MAPTAAPLAPTPHFGILDGLRGIAALTVVLFHFMEIVITEPARNFTAHAYLAVDFFFCLSGFVIACAYDTRLASIGVLAFLRRRLIRLHPLVVIGALLGLLTFRFDPFSHLYATYADKLLPLFLSSALLIPYPLVRERYFNLFHLNPPTWSLFWEYIANVAYALVLVRLRPTALRVATLLAAGVLCYEAYHAGQLGVGWGGDTFWGGAIRVSYSFLIGIVVYRSHWRLPSRLGFPAIGALLLAALLLPFIPSLNWLLDPLVILFYFPFLVALGVGAELSARFSKLCTFLGELSYPLYMVHYPFIWVFMSYLQAYKPPMSTLCYVIPLAMLALVLLAWATLTWVDAPLRRYLSRSPAPKRAG